MILESIRCAYIQVLLFRSRSLKVVCFINKVSSTETTTQTTTTTTTETTTETTTTTTTETTEATTAVYKGSETVEVYGYDVKVAVAVDGDGKIISVLDDNTDTQDMFNEMFYSKAIAMFKNFIGKTVSELDDVDGVSSATYSSNAIRGAVKNALSSIPVSLDLSSNFVSGGAVNANNSFAEVALKSSNDSVPFRDHSCSCQGSVHS